MAKRPNFLMISMDGLRYDAVENTGVSSAHTPNLDDLIDHGIQFNRAYCTQPICMPCRSSIITGRYPSAHGVWENGVPLQERPEAPTVGHCLRNAGYRTHLYGKAHFQPWLRTLESDEQGHYPEYIGDGPYYGFDHVRISDHSAEDRYHGWVRQHHPDWVELARNPRKERNGGAINAWKTSLPREATKSHYIADLTIDAIERADEPFMIWASFIDPHHPYNPPSPFQDWYDDIHVPLPPHASGPPANLSPHYHRWRQWQHDPAVFGNSAQAHYADTRRLYLGAISHVDWQIGRVLDALRRRGLWEDTVIVFLSDHGCMLGEMGLLQIGPYAREIMHRIPMIWHVPGQSGGRSCDALVSAVDLMPTILKMAGVPVPDSVQGRALCELLRDQDVAWRDRLIIENRWGQNPPDGFRTLVTQRYKLSIYSTGECGELYDLATDADEVVNRFNDPDLSEVRAQLMEQFVEASTGMLDPLPHRVACW